MFILEVTCNKIQSRTILLNNTLTIMAIFAANTTLSVQDETMRYPSGGAGFRVDSGTMMVDDILVEAAP